MYTRYIELSGYQTDYDSPNRPEVIWGYTLFAKFGEINYFSSQDDDDSNEEYEMVKC